MKRDTEKVPTDTPFLTFSTPEMPKEITTGYLKVQVTLVCSKPDAATTATSLATRANAAKLLQNVSGAGKK